MSEEKQSTFATFTETEWAEAFGRLWPGEVARGMAADIVRYAESSNGFGLSPHTLALLSLVNESTAERVESIVRRARSAEYANAVRLKREELSKIPPVVE